MLSSPCAWQSSPGQQPKARWAVQRAERARRIRAALDNLLVTDTIQIVESYAVQALFVVLNHSGRTVTAYDPAAQEWLESGYKLHPNLRVSHEMSTLVDNILHTFVYTNHGREATHHTLDLATGLQGQSLQTLTLCAGLPPKHLITSDNDHHLFLLVCLARGATLILRRLDCVTGQWQTLQTPIVYPDTHCTARLVALRNSLYLVTSGSLASATRVCHDSTKAHKEWTRRAPIPFYDGDPQGPRSHFTLVALHDRSGILCCGGRVCTAQKDIVVPSCVYYNATTDHWLDVAPMGFRRADASAAYIDGHVVVCGGWTFQELLQSAEQYDPRTGRWSPLPAIPVAALPNQGGLTSVQAHVW